MLVDRRDELGRARTQTINRLHRLLLELFPGGAKQFLSSQQARALIATIRPRDIVGKTRRRLAVELIGELEAIDKKIKAAEKDLTELVTARGSTLMDLHGIGPSGAARLLADVGDIRRFADRDRFASWNGTAPLDASSGEQKRHRLSRAGNRRINRTLHIMAVVQLRHPTEGRAYFDTKKAAGKTSMEAMRALKRRLSNVVYARMVEDQKRREAAGPGGHSGTTLQSSVTDLTPDIGSSDKPLPGPANTHPRTRLPARVLTQRGAMRVHSARMVTVRRTILADGRACGGQSPPDILQTRATFSRYAPAGMRESSTSDRHHRRSLGTSSNETRGPGATGPKAQRPRTDEGRELPSMPWATTGSGLARTASPTTAPTFHRVARSPCLPRPAGPCLAASYPDLSAAAGDLCRGQPLLAGGDQVGQHLCLRQLVVGNGGWRRRRRLALHPEPPAGVEWHRGPRHHGSAQSWLDAEPPRRHPGRPGCPRSTPTARPDRPASPPLPCRARPPSWRARPPARSARRGRASGSGTRRTTRSTAPWSHRGSRSGRPRGPQPGSTHRCMRRYLHSASRCAPEVVDGAVGQVERLRPAVLLGRCRPVQRLGGQDHRAVVGSGQ